MLTGVQHSTAARRMLLNAGIPVVEVWDLSETPIDCCVGFSHIDAGIEAADFAIDAGYRHAATVTAGDERARRRRDGFAERFGRRSQSRVDHVDFAQSATLRHGREALAQLAERGLRKGTVLFCSSDQFAHGILVEAAARGLRVPDDVAVIGFGDQEFAAWTEPALTSMRIDRQALGQAAANALLNRFLGSPKLPAVHDIGFELVRRASA